MSTAPQADKKQPGFDEYDEITYWSIVWEQFKKNRLAYIGAWGIVIAVVLAIIAPVICLDFPFMITYPDEAGQMITEYPWFTRLFDRNLFENGVDLFFNLVLALLPIILLSAAVTVVAVKKRRRRDRTKVYRYVTIAWVVILTAMVTWLQLDKSSSPYEDYRAIYANTKAELDAEIMVLTSQGVSPDDPRIKELEAKMPSVLSPPVPQSFRKPDLNAVLAEPNIVHFLGTDDRGRDVFARLLYGTRIALTIGGVAVSIYVTIGLILGALAGYFRGWVDAVILRCIEVMLCFPSFILILTLVAFIDNPSIFHVMLIIGVTRWTGPARLIRGEFLRLGAQDFVAAAQASGIPEWRVIFRHVLPNALSPVLVNATFGVAAAILIESALSFLGIGDPSAPSWGEVLNIGRQTSTLRMILAPGLAIFFAVSLFNIVGEGFRDALDPKLRK